MKAWFARLTDPQIADIIINDKIPVLFEEGPLPIIALGEVASAVEGESIVFISKDLSFIHSDEIKEAGRDLDGDSIRDTVTAQGSGGQ